MYKVPEEWKLSDFLELSNDEKLKWLYNGVKNGGGGGGSSDVFEVNFTLVEDDETETYTVTSDKTFSEISAAFTANKKVYAWLRDTDNEFYYQSNGNDFNPEYDGGSFYFSLNKAPGLTIIYTISIDPESISVTNTWSNSPVYIMGGFSFGSTLPTDLLELHNAALRSGSPVIIGLSLADNDNNSGEFLIAQEIPYGYCFAGTPGAIGATVLIDTETGLITGNPAND